MKREVAVKLSLLVVGITLITIASKSDPQARQNPAFPGSYSAPGPRRDNRHEFIEKVSREIAILKKKYPQLSEFSATNHVNFVELKISYAYHTHRAEHRGGWTAGVPNPDADGIWFYIDLHNANSTAQIHTQPVTIPLCFGDDRVSFLILEGADTKPVSGEIQKILERHGAKRCAE